MPHADMFGLAHRPSWYARLTGAPFRMVHRRVVSDVTWHHLPPQPRILDIGTGPGGLPVAIASAVCTARVVGIDLSPAMIEHARATNADHDRVEFVVGDVARLPFDDGSFDLVVSSMSQHHWGDVGAGVREIGRVLRPDGEAWIYDARIALRRAYRAASASRPNADVDLTPVRTGRVPVRLIGRLRIAPRPARSRL